MPNPLVRQRVVFGGGAGAGPPVPLTIPNLQVWYDVPRESYANLDPIGQLTDWSGNGRHATQATTAKKPTFRTSIQNSRAVARYDQIDDVLAANALAPVFSGDDMSFSILAVYKLASTSGTQSLVGAGRTSNGNPLYEMLRHVGAYASFKRDDVAASVSQSAGTLDTAWHTMSVVVPGTTISQWRDGTVVINAAAYNIGQTTIDEVGIGAAYFGAAPGSNFFGGDLGELLIYSGVLSTVNRQALEAYLKGRWNTP